ncbi:putative glycolipid-binding domain-containing protein [Arenimonas sp. MALMAid1274]|uniref:putative glycolipid-binding domain-containing protein n=1 Tax=Arenimonas sp. MALMAid1274 TaxID=3411630 RepID=UPI003BA2B0CE
MHGPDHETTHAWLRIEDHGSLEHARLQPAPDGWRADGTVLAIDAGSPLRVDYRLTLDARWRTRELWLEQTWHGARSTLRLQRADDDSWQQDGQPVLALQGCQDVDLGLSPLTNTPPIRRMLADGLDRASFDMAWVQFPGPRVTRAAQRYTRLDAGRWRYEGLGSHFEAELDVDPEGIVTRYGQLWQRIAQG